MRPDRRAPNPLQPRREMSNVYRAIGEELEMEPTMYLPSSTDDAEVCWLMYSYGLNVETGATFAMSPMVDRVMKAIYRRLEGHHFFGETMRPDSFPFFTLAMLAAAEVAIRPSRAKELAHLLRGAGSFSRLRDTLRMHYIVVQQAPKVDAAHGKVQICWQCPDATIRAGRLTPVCIASAVRPFPGRPARAPRQVVDAIDVHLEGRVT